MWARAMYTYDQVAKNIGPKKEALAQAEGELAVVQAELAKKQEALGKVRTSHPNDRKPSRLLWSDHYTVRSHVYVDVLRYVINSFNVQGPF